MAVSQPDIANSTAKADNLKWEHIANYLVNKTYPEECLKGEKDVIRRQSKDYRIMGGKLFYVRHMKSKKKKDSLNVEVYY